MRNSYVSLNNYYYNVPKEYISDTVELLYDGDMVEIYHKFRHITIHRMDDTPFTYSEKPSHKLPGVLHEYRIRMDDIYRKTREINPEWEEYIKLVAVAKNILSRPYVQLMVYYILWNVSDTTEGFFHAR